MDAMEVEPIVTGQNDALAIRSNLGYPSRDHINQCMASYFRDVLTSRAFEISHHFHAMMYQRAIQMQMQMQQIQSQHAIMGNSPINFAAAANPFMVPGNLRPPPPVAAPFMNGMNSAAAFMQTQQQTTARVVAAPPMPTTLPQSQSNMPTPSSLELEDVDHSFNPNPHDYNVLFEMMFTFCKMFGCEENRRPHIVEFIFNELKNFQNRNVIQWTGLDGSFKVNNPQELAHRWGMTKGSKNMTYEKMSRSIRNYYKKGTISKIRHHYCYRINMNELGASSDNRLIRSYFLNRRAVEFAGASQPQPSPPTSVSDVEDGGAVVEEMST